MTPHAAAMAYERARDSVDRARRTRSGTVAIRQHELKLAAAACLEAELEARAMERERLQDAGRVA